MKRRLALLDGNFLRATGALAAALAASTALSDPITTGLAEAAPGNTFALSVSDTEYYDSNLFKLPNDVGTTVVVGAPTGSKSDEYNVASVGTDIQRVLGRQTFDVQLNVNENRFDHNSQLDNTSGNGKLLWDWELGSYLSGQVSASYYRGLASFLETLYTGKDLIDTTSYFADGRYQIGPRWALLFEVQSDYTTHGAEAVQYNNFRDQTLSGGVEFALTPLDTFSVVYHHFEGSYPRGYPVTVIDEGAPTDRNYHEDFPQLYIKYSLSEKTAFDGNVGRLRRVYDGFEDGVPIGDFTGIIWRAGVRYNITEKLGVGVRAWHEIHAYSASDSDYFVSKGESIGPNWSPTDKLNFSAQYSTEKDTYLPGSTSVFLLGSRRDTQSYEQFDASYTPRDRWNINLFVRHFERGSNQELVAFTDQFANLSVSYKFF